MVDLHLDCLMYDHEGVEEHVRHPVSLSVFSWDSQSALFGYFNGASSNWVVAYVR